VGEVGSNEGADVGQDSGKELGIVDVSDEG